MSFKSFLGWLILLGALAVPAVMFWNWWTKMQAPPVEARRAGASAGFGAVTMMQGAPAGAAPPAGAQQAAPPAASSGTAAAQTLSVSSSAVIAPAPLTAAGPAGAAPIAASVQIGAPPPAASGPAGGVALGKDAIEYNPSTTRDPTLSPIDLKILAKLELDKLNAKKEVIKKVEEYHPKVILKPIEEKLEVEGIVATRNGIMVLINGERYREGDQIMGAVIKRITTRMVVFKYGGRTFSKRVE